MGKYSKKRALEDDANSGPEESSKPVKKSKNNSSTLETGKDSDGNHYWEIAPKRRVGVSKFKNNTLVNIREYYEADGQMKPGKKGISLTVEQYQAFIKVIPAINSQLREAGLSVDDLALAVTGGDLQEDVETKKKAQNTAVKARKANIEATSDEESD